MWLLAALGTAVCFGINNTLFKWGTSHQLSKVSIQFFFYLVAFLITLTYGMVSKNFHPGLLALVVGSLAGILNANGNIQMTKAFEKGPASLTSTLIATNAIIPALASGIIFPEPMLFAHWIGIMLMIGAAVMIQYQPAGSIQTEYKPWMYRIGLSLLSFGSVSFLLKISTYYHIQFLDMLIFMYAGGLAYLSFLMRGESVKVLEIKVATIVGLLSTIGFSSYLFALKTGPASIIFPIISLNCLVVMMSGLFIFKERLRTYQLVGMMIALVGLVLIKI
jgi:drug/metabolite transporter (DMT)-like permease